MSLLGNLIGVSPIRPMQRHMEAAVECAREVMPLFEEMAAGKIDQFIERRKKIDSLEHQADEIKHEIRSKLPSRLFMAFERRDILEILDAQDSIADRAQDIAGLVEQRSMVLPKALVEPVMDLVRGVIAACEYAGEVIEELDELLETGFSGRGAAKVEEMIKHLNHLESETDRQAEKAQRALFEIENEIGVGTVFWYQLINWVGQMADNAERVGNRLRLLIAT